MTSTELEKVLLDLLRNTDKNLLIFHTPEVSSIIGETILKPERWIGGGKTLFIGPLDHMRGKIPRYRGDGELYLVDLNDVIFTIWKDPDEVEEFTNFVKGCKNVVILNYTSLFEPLKSIGMLLMLEEAFQRPRIILTQVFLPDDTAPIKIWSEPIILNEAFIIYNKKKYRRTPLHG